MTRIDLSGLSPMERGRVEKALDKVYRWGDGDYSLRQPAGQALAAWAAELARPAEAGYWERLQARRAAFLKYQAAQGPGTGSWLVGF